MSRSSLVIQQCQEQLAKLNSTVTDVMQSGISLAEDLQESDGKYVGHVDEIEKAMLEFATLSNDVACLKGTMVEVENVISSLTEEERPPDLVKIFEAKLLEQHKMSGSGFDPATHPLVDEFHQRLREEDMDTDEETQTQDGDEEIVVAQVKKSLTCPLTKKFLEDPVTSKTCNHSYSRAAITDHLKRRSNSKCPVCNTPLKLSDLEKDDKLGKLVRKAKRKEGKNQKKSGREGVVKL